MTRPAEVQDRDSFPHAFKSIPDGKRQFTEKAGSKVRPHCPSKGPRSLRAVSQDPRGNSFLVCPECGSNRLYKDGLRYNADGSVRQRWLCRACGFRFTEPKISVNVKGKGGKRLDSGSDLPEGRVGDSDFSVKECLNGFSLSLGEDVGSHGLTTAGKELNNFLSYDSKRQVCALKKAKNLDSATETKIVAGEIEKLPQDAKGLIAQFLAYLEKEGYSEETQFPNILRRLVKLGANLLNPESVKEVIGRQKVKDGMKLQYVYA